MSLAHLLECDEPCPTPLPYLTADAGQVAGWRTRLAGLPGLKVGLVWAGNAGFAADHLRSIPVEALAPLARVDRVTLISLQKGAHESPALPMHDWTSELDTMAQTAALVGALDLVVSVDTAVAHLAGALGKAVWLLNRADSCWRWGRLSEGCTWYPTLRQFRQDVPGDWFAPLLRLVAALEVLAIEHDRARPWCRVAPRT